MITLRLLLAHMIGDYTLQTGQIARYKAEGWPGLLIHAAIVTLVSGLLIAGLFPYWWAWALVLGGIHLGIDQLRTFHLKDMPAEFALPYLLFDQGLHLLTIVAIAWLGAHETPAEVWHFLRCPETTEVLWPAFVTVVICLIWTTAVLEMAVLRTFNWLFHMPPPAAIRPADRLAGATERLFALLLLLTPYPWVYPIVFVPRLYWGIWHASDSTPPLAYGVRSLVSFLMATGAGLFMAHLSRAVR
ncbi:MAG: DUF3307 domain-containing protein [Anaerolineae bacterium]|nr:DUF3307 domain-containing protein [Anaerolineae bacterium]